MPHVVLVGHGSRDPRSARELRLLTDRVSAAGDRDLDVRLAFLELSEPLLEDVLAEVTGAVIVVPLLLGTAFHATFDLPGRLAEVQRSRADLILTQTDVLGPDARLDAAVNAQLRALAAQGCDGFVLLGTGSSHPRANADVAAVAARARFAANVPGEAAFVTAAPGLGEVVADLRARGADRVGIVPWFLAPGRLLDAGLAKAAELGIDACAPTLASHDLMVDIVLDRVGVARSRRQAA